jgi:predicted DNA-binding transcriptional regulator YafY
MPNHFRAIMSEAVRLYKYQALLSTGRSVSKERLMAIEEVSPATFKRDLAKLRDQMGVPIQFDRETGGYVLRQGAGRYELPGFWLSQEEIIGLATIQKMISQMAPSLMGPQLEPLEAKLEELLSKHGLSAGELSRRVKLMYAGKRQLNAKIFETVAQATFTRKRLALHHFNRSKGEQSTREISPIDITLYRGNWYVNAWCHLRDDLRRFSIDAIEHVTMLEQSAEEIDENSVERGLGAGYGIYSGKRVQRAMLRFTPERARWVRTEEWHPEQVGSLLQDGSYQLEVPYTDEREILADLMRYGAGVEVMGPAELRQAMKIALHEAIGRYL